MILNVKTENRVYSIVRSYVDRKWDAVPEFIYFCNAHKMERSEGMGQKEMPDKYARYEFAFRWCSAMLQILCAGFGCMQNFVMQLCYEKWPMHKMTLPFPEQNKCLKKYSYKDIERNHSKIADNEWNG